MSWKATAYVKSLSVAPNGQKLKRGEKLLLLVLADYHHEAKKYAWASTNTLAKDALLSRRYVQMLLESARAKQVICVEHRVNKQGDAAPNHYRFHAIDCDKDHEGGGELGSPPPGEKSSPRGEKSSPPPGDLFSPRGEPQFTTGGDPEITTGGDLRITTVVKSDATPYKDEPQLEPQPEPQPEPTHTHDATPAPSPIPDGPGACVSVEVTRQDYFDFARSTPTFTNPDAWAAKHWALRDSDDLVREWKERQRPENVERARAERPDERKTFGEAAAHVRSILSLGAGHDPAQIIAGLDVSDEVRAQLLERFAPAGRAEGT